MKTTALRHRVGSLLIVGVESTSLSVLEMAWLASLQPSGMILFRRNIEAAAAAACAVATSSAVLDRTFFSLRRSRRRHRRSAARPGGPDAFRCGGCGDQPAGSLSRERRDGRKNAACARTSIWIWLRCWIWRLPASREVMGTRVVSADPAKVIAYAREFIAGLRQHGIVACGKHFPGLGGGTLDSHHATPSIGRTWEQMWEQDLEPYRALRPRCHWSW